MTEDIVSGQWIAQIGMSDTVARIPGGELTDDRQGESGDTRMRTWRRNGRWMGGRQQTARLDWIGTISRVTAGVISVDVNSVRGNLRRRSALDTEISETEKNKCWLGLGCCLVPVLALSLSLSLNHHLSVWFGFLLFFLWQNAEMVRDRVS